MKTVTLSDWPVLKRYDQDHLRKIAMPIGGIGTGTISLGGRGNLTDWEVVNRPAKGFTPNHTFFSLYAKSPNQSPVTRVLEGVIDPLDYEGPHGCHIPNHGLPRFRDCSFESAYPFGQVVLSDPDVPLDVRMGAFNPLIPGDEYASGIPVAILKFQLTNKTSEHVNASISGCVENFIGRDGLRGLPKNNQNLFKQSSHPARLKGIFMKSEGVDPLSEQYGTFSISTTSDHVSYSNAWKGWDVNHSWGEKLINFWDDFSSDGKLEPYENIHENNPIGSVAANVEVPANGTEEVTFVLSWYFPNRQSYDILIKPKIERKNTKCCGGGICTCEPTVRVGNYYCTQYEDAWDVAEKTVLDLPRLERDTLLFVNSFLDSSFPDVVKEAALNNISILRSQTCFRTEDGRFHGWEGCNHTDGSCQGTCTHVWNYELVTPFLFGNISRNMREVEFMYAVDEQGLLNHRINIPLKRARDFGVSAADGQMGTIMRLYRYWKLSGDDELLQRIWPQVRKAMEFSWIKGGWDADKDGVMEGRQHVTYDVEFYGPNPLVAGWYLGALRSMEEMATFMNEDEFAEQCGELFQRGRNWIDQHLFNGQYYEQDVRSFDPDTIASGLSTGEGAVNSNNPELQLGKGCLADQLVGQYMSHVNGLGYLLDQDNINTTLKSIMKFNYRSDMYGHFNPMRSFVMNEEPALMVCTYPLGEKPKFSFPYFSEVWNGLEYVVANHMLYEGQIEDGIECIRNIRSRYDGRKRNPFNEAECGYHYVRSMTSWGAVLALSGFQYSANDHLMEFKFSHQQSKTFWSNGFAWGTFEQGPTNKGVNIKLTVLHGKIKLKKLILKNYGMIQLAEQRYLEEGDTIHETVMKL